MYQRKTTDEIVIQGNYGYGWDDLTTEVSMPEARKTLRVYQKNEQNAAHRIITRRVKNSTRFTRHTTTAFLALHGSNDSQR